MNELSSNESFIKSQESLVQGAIRTPKPINLLETQFNEILNKYNITESAKINRKPIILVNEEKYEHNSKDNISKIKARRRKSRKTERKLDVEEHERALSEIKKIASIMDSNHTISNRRGHSRVNSRSNLKLSEKIWGVEEEDEDDLEIFLGHSSSSENSSKSTLIESSSGSLNNSTTKINNTQEQEAGDSNNSLPLVISPESRTSSVNNFDFSKKSQPKLVIPSTPNPIFNHLGTNNNFRNEDVFFSKEDVFKKNKFNGEEDAQSDDSKKDGYDDEEKKLNNKRKKTRLKQFLKLHRENCLLEVPNALYTDIISESIKILTKTSQNYVSQLGKKDESTIGSLNHLKHLKSMIPSGNQYQQHIDNNCSKYGPGYYQLCAPIDENGQYVKLKEKILINSLDSINSIK